MHAFYVLNNYFSMVMTLETSKRVELKYIYA